MTATPIVALDTETTGVHPERQVWEIGMIRRDDDGQRETQFYVDVDLDQADPFGLSVGRFYERHPLGRYVSGRDDAPAPARPQRLAAIEVARWTHGAHVVGAVPNFDTEVLSSLLRAHGAIPAWHYHLIDVETLAVGYLHAQAVEFPGSRAADFVAGGLPWDSDDLTAALDLDPVPEDERHTALGDARWAMRIYDAVTAAS